MAAAQGPAAARDFFNSRMVLAEGARVRCSDPELGQQVGAAASASWACAVTDVKTHPRKCLSGLPPMQGWCTLVNIERFKFLLEKVGLYRRLSAPQALLRQHERQIQRRLQAGQTVQL